MATINVKGPVVDNATGDFMDYFEMQNVCPKKVSDALSNLTNGEQVDVQIASDGGDVFAASEIYTMLRNAQQNNPVTANIEGLAASAASVIAMACSTINMSPSAQMMIHKASVGSMSGNADDLEQVMNSLNSTDQMIVGLYSERTGLDDSTILQMMSNTTFMNAKEAKDKGFCDNIMTFADSQKQPVLSNSFSAVPTQVGLAKFKEMLKAGDLPSKENKAQKPTSQSNEKLAILLEKFNLTKENFNEQNQQLK